MAWAWAWQFFSWPRGAASDSLSNVHGNIARRHARPTKRVAVALFFLSVVAMGSTSVLVLVLSCRPFGLSNIDGDDGSLVGDVGDAQPLANIDCGAKTNASVLDDPRNCGSCSHDCNNGACVNGRCRPYAIATSPGVPWYVTIDDTHVYWTSHINPAVSTGDGKVRSVPKGGGPVTVLAESPESFDLHVFNDRVFFTATSQGMGGLYHVGRQGGRIDTVFDGGSLDIAQHGEELFVSTIAGSATGLHVISFTPALKDILLYPPPLQNAEGIAADSSHIYWVNHAATTGAIYRIDRSGTQTDLLAGDEPGARRMLDDEVAIYWTSELGDRGVSRCLKGAVPCAGAVTQILKAKVRYGSMALDGPHLYVAVEDEGRIVRINKIDGSDLVVIADGLQRPTGIAVDSTAIYFTDRGSQEVRRAQK